MEESERSKPAILVTEFEELWQRATKDSLSGLLNRATSEQYIKDRIQSLGKDENCAIFIIDLDDFKKVNDTYGHIAGDQAIREASEILTRLFKANDIVGRLGGDEFVAFVTGSDITYETVSKKGEEICSALQITIGNVGSMNLTASVGIYLSDGSQEFEGMYQSADLALYKAKKAGKHGYCMKSHDLYQKGYADDFTPVNAIPVGSLLEYLDSGIALIEMKTEGDEIIYVSPSFCRLTGADVNAVKLPLKLSDVVHPDDVENFEADLLSALENDKAIESIIRIKRYNTELWPWWKVRAVHFSFESNNPVMLISAMDVSSFKENEKILSSVNEILRTAFDQTTGQLWQVDVENREFTSYAKKNERNLSGIHNVLFPDYLIEQCYIHPSSQEAFKEFASELLSGQSQGYGNFIIRPSGDSSYNWCSLSYRMIYDKNGQPLRAVGIAEILARSFAGQSLDSVPDRFLPEALLTNLIVRTRLNLTKNTIEDLWFEGKALETLPSDTSADSILNSERENIFRNNNENSNLLSYFDRNKLIQQYEKGTRWLTAVYQRADTAGNIRTIRHTFHLMKSSTAEDVCLNAYIVRENLPKELEKLALKEKEVDITTGLYSRASIQNIIEGGMKAGIKMAIALFQINGLDSIEKDYIEPARNAIISALSIGLGGSVILGYYSDERILILFPLPRQKEEVQRQIEDAYSFIRRTTYREIAQASYSLRYVTGIALASNEGVDFKTLLSKALYLCNLWWNASSDMIAFSNDENNSNFSELQESRKNDKINILSSSFIPMNESEKDVAFECISAMLRAESLESSILSVLTLLGEHYAADRVYILHLNENSRSVTMPYEWESAYKRPIKFVVSGMPIERFPILMKCLEEKKPVILNRTKDDDNDQDWGYAAFPLMQGGNITGFIAIENPKNNIVNSSLFSIIIPYLQKESDRFGSYAKIKGRADQLMDLPDLRSYLDTINTLTDESYSSLGCVCLDIPGMASINGSLGFEYGNKLLWFISKMLTDTFGKSLVFRTWEAEFIAFSPDTTQSVFLSKYGRLKLLLQRDYAKDVRLGQSWKEGHFNGKAIVEEARLNMRSYKIERNQVLPNLILSNASITYDSNRNKEKFTVFYQPKIDMRDGSLIGAEALVRGVDEDGAIIPPQTFISTLEERGGIRELDLFVLEKTLTQMSRWKDAGYGDIPVSVNLSRITLLYPSTLASVLAIQSRFPDIKPENIELEITENAGILETSEFREIADMFRANGLKIALDDFGSHYANLSIFANVKFDTIKLDKSLISGLAGNNINRMLIRDIVQICKKSHMDAIAEGVETLDQQKALLNAGCTKAQGFLYDKPLPADEFEEKYFQSMKKDKQE